MKSTIQAGWLALVGMTLLAPGVAWAGDKGKKPEEPRKIVIQLDASKLPPSF